MIQRGLLTLCFWLLPFAVLSADLTERQWMEQLVSGLGWEYGLPDEPQDEDYIRLLSGERSVWFEVETSHRKTDRVAVKHYTNYGGFSGSGWVSGFRQPTEIHLDFLLLHSSRYDLAIGSRLPGIRIAVAGNEFTAPGGDSFDRHELGAVDLPAGPTGIVITLPPNAAIDYLQLQAPAFAKIAPLGGWQPDRPIKTADLALTGAQLLDLLALLPSAQQALLLEMETAATVTDAQRSSAAHLGVPSSSFWLRSENQPARIATQVAVPQAACYQALLRGSGTEPALVRLEGAFSKEVRFGSALTTRSLGSYCLPKQKLKLEIQLPAWAGVDLFELRQYDTSATSLARLLGLSSEQLLLDKQVVNELLELMSGMIR
ncbi:MAG TPA: hypothetical protein VIR78_07635 [Malonomonas sp.]